VTSTRSLRLIFFGDFLSVLDVLSSGVISKYKDTYYVVTSFALPPTKQISHDFRFSGNRSREINFDERRVKMLMTE
jgi:hypothetical protein